MARERIKAQALTDVDDKLVAIQDIENRIHEGEVFVGVTSVTLGAAGVQDYLFKTGAKTAHIFGFVSGVLGGHVEIYEDTTVSANGTQGNIYNVNRTSANTPLAVLYAGPTVTGVGNVIDRYNFASGLNAGGEHLAANEWIFKANSNYLFRVTSDNASNRIILRASWYEV